MNAVSLLLGDERGIYIPLHFVNDFDVTKWGLTPNSWEVITCMAGPDDEGYWEAWDQILDHAEYHKDGNVWQLHQDGDLFALCYELMTDEEKDNFGFED